MRALTLATSSLTRRAMSHVSTIRVGASSPRSTRARISSEFIRNSASNRRSMDTTSPLGSARTASTTERIAREDPYEVHSEERLNLHPGSEGIVEAGGGYQCGACCVSCWPSRTAPVANEVAPERSIHALSTDRFRRRRKVRVRVRAGDVLGHVRGSLRIRLGLSRLIDGQWMAIDPAELIHAWPVLPWFAEPASRVGSKVAV